MELGSSNLWRNGSGVHSRFFSNGERNKKTCMYSSTAHCFSWYGKRKKQEWVNEYEGNGVKKYEISRDINLNLASHWCANKKTARVWKQERNVVKGEAVKSNVCLRTFNSFICTAVIFCCIFPIVRSASIRCISHSLKRGDTVKEGTKGLHIHIYTRFR